MCCQTSQSSLLMLCYCSFLSGRQLILCAVVAGTTESVPSYQAGSTVWLYSPLLMSCSSM